VTEWNGYTIPYTGGRGIVYAAPASPLLNALVVPSHGTIKGKTLKYRLYQLDEQPAAIVD